jgi:hypothetical protein
MAKESNTVPALEVAKARSNGDPKSANVRTLSDGTQVRLVPVATTLLEEVRKRVPDPVVPKVYIAEKDRHEENRSDPDYLRGLREAEDKRNAAIMDAIVLFGIELVDGMPENESWLKKLRYMEKLGELDLSAYDLEDELDKEFLYKRYIAGSASLMMDVGKLSGISEQEVSEAEKPFPGN